MHLKLFVKQNNSKEFRQLVSVRKQNGINYKSKPEAVYCMKMNGMVKFQSNYA
jgi:hypothetical protein